MYKKIHFLTYKCYYLLNITSMRQYLCVILICIFLMADGVESRFM